MQEKHHKELTSRKEVVVFRNGWRGAKGTLVQSELTEDIQPPQFTFQISCIGCLRIAGALPFLIPFINSKFLFILFPTYNPIKLTSA